MSADCWRRCPKCLKEATDNRERAVQRAQSQYGKIAEPAYRKLIAKAESPVELEETLREDYCVRVDEDGEFSVDYSASCDRCGFEFQHKHTEQALKQ